MVFLIFFVRASGEAILGTLKYFPERFLNKKCSRLRRGDLGTLKYVSEGFLIYVFRTSDKAILGIQR